jgi:hypothetical protein
LDHIVASDVVSGLLAGEWSAPLPFLSNLVEAVGERDRALLDELERLVKTKQRRLGRDGRGMTGGNGVTKPEEP